MILIGCSNEQIEPKDDPLMIEEPDLIISNGIKGNIQKGPFISGSNVTIQELDSSIIATGVTFNTTTINDFGGFEIESKIKAPFLEIITTGFYFDEVKGSISDANLSLRSLALSTDSLLSNVNLLTTLARERIIFLIKNQGFNYDSAKTKSQNEILTIFNIPPDENINFNELDISKEGENNGVLLAISIIIQGEQSIGKLSEMISKMILDLKEDGELNSTDIIESIRQNAEQLDLRQIRQNLKLRYLDLGFEANIPPFEKYAKRLVPLEVLNTFPTPHQMEVKSDIPEISVYFNKSLDPETVNSTNVQIVTEDGSEVPGQLNYDEDSLKIQFVPSNELLPSTKYLITITKGIKGIDTDTLSNDFNFDFNSLGVDIESDFAFHFTPAENNLDKTGNGFSLNPVNITLANNQNNTPNMAYGLSKSSNSYIELPADLKLWKDEWTYLIWARLDNANEFDELTLLGNQYIESGKFLDVYLALKTRDLDNNEVYIRPACSINDDFLVIDEAPSIDLNSWHHYVVTHNSNSIKVYMDGEFVNEFERSFSYEYPSSSPYEIGAKDVYRSNFDGAVSDIRFYKRALNKFEVLRIFDVEK
jgi:hypothetical protein